MELVKKYLFWMVMAAVIVVVIVADVVVVGSMGTKVARSRSGLRLAMKDGNALIQSSDFIPAKQAVEDYSQYKQAMQAEVKDALGFYRGLQVDWYKSLPGTEGQMGPRGLPRPEAFKSAYTGEMEKLKQRLVSAGILMAEGAWEVHDWGDSLPSNDDISLAQVEYWLLNDIIDVLVNDSLKVKGLLNVTIDSSVIEEQRREPEEMAPEEMLARAPSSMFSNVPFAVEVEVDYRTVPLFLQALERMNRRRTVRVKQVGIARVTNPEDEKIYSPVVTVRGDCEVLYYAGSIGEEEATGS